MAGSERRKVDGRSGLEPLGDGVAAAFDEDFETLGIQDVVRPGAEQEVYVVVLVGDGQMPDVRDHFLIDVHLVEVDHRLGGHRLGEAGADADEAVRAAEVDIAVGRDKLGVRDVFIVIDPVDVGERDHRVVLAEETVEVVAGAQPEVAVGVAQDGLDDGVEMEVAEVGGAGFKVEAPEAVGGGEPEEPVRANDAAAQGYAFAEVVQDLQAAFGGFVPFVEAVVVPEIAALAAGNGAEVARNASGADAELFEDARAGIVAADVVRKYQEAPLGVVVDAGAFAIGQVIVLYVGDELGRGDGAVVPVEGVEAFVRAGEDQTVGIDGGDGVDVHPGRGRVRGEAAFLRVEGHQAGAVRSHPDPVAGAVLEEGADAAVAGERTDIGGVEALDERLVYDDGSPVRASAPEIAVMVAEDTGDSGGRKRIRVVLLVVQHLESAGVRVQDADAAAVGAHPDPALPLGEAQDNVRAESRVRGVVVIKEVSIQVNAVDSVTEVGEPEAGLGVSEGGEVFVGPEVGLEEGADFSCREVEKGEHPAELVEEDKDFLVVVEGEKDAGNIEVLVAVEGDDLRE